MTVVIPADGTFQVLVAGEDYERDLDGQWWQLSPGPRQRVPYPVVVAGLESIFLDHYPTGRTDVDSDPTPARGIVRPALHVERRWVQ